MKARFANRFATVILFAVVGFCGGLVAREQSARANTVRRDHYTLVDLGTFGGPSAYTSANGEGYQILNDAGVVAFGADTSMVDPNAPGLCYVADCFVAHTARWKNGTATDLGALPGKGNGSLPGAINARGWIVGQSENGEIDPVSGAPEVRAVVWSANQIIDLGTFGGNWSVGSSLNNVGDVVGFASNAVADPFPLFPPGGTETRAFLWRNGPLQDLGTLGGNDAQAFSVNQRGQVVGISYTSSTPNVTTGIPDVHPFVWDHGVMTDLGTLGGTYAGPGNCSFGAPFCATPGAPDEGGLVPNNRGQVSGTSNLTGDQTYHPFLWDHGTMTDLGTLGGDNGTASWITDPGEVVGDADLPHSPPGCVGVTCVHHAFAWQHGTMTDLGTLHTDPCSRARMANSEGQVVGETAAICGGSPSHAFLWESGGPIVDLNTLIPPGSGATLFDGDAINERGEIVASGLPAGCADPSSCSHVYLLIPKNQKR